MIKCFWYIEIFYTNLQKSHQIYKGGKMARSCVPSQKGDFFNLFMHL